LNQKLIQQSAAGGILSANVEALSADLQEEEQQVGRDDLIRTKTVGYPEYCTILKCGGLWVQLR
jgi:hypothetical protein